MKDREKRLDRWIRSLAARVTNDKDTVGKVRGYIAVAAMVALIALAGAFFAGQASAQDLAHNGQVSQKDQCHKKNAKVDGVKITIERHWHLDPDDAGGKKTKRGGPCVTRGGKTYRLAKHALCADERIDLLVAQETYGTDYKRLAAAFKRCVINMNAPAQPG